MSRAVVLLSGGLDSYTAAAVARRDGFELFALTVRYGQRHAEEIAASRRVAAALGVSQHLELDVDLSRMGGSALTADIDVPKSRAESEMASAIPVTYVPARNLVFLSLALAFAETVGAFELFIGINSVDYSGYPDCRREFIDEFERTATLATKAGVERRAEGVRRPLFRVRTPLVSLSKAEIIRRGTGLGVDFSLTTSCYDPVFRDARWLACGRCDSCTLRSRGFAQAGIADPTPYAERPEHGRAGLLPPPVGSSRPGVRA